MSNLYWLSDEEWSRIEPRCFHGVGAEHTVLMITG